VSDQTTAHPTAELAPTHTTPLADIEEQKEKPLDPSCHKVKSRSRNVAFGSSGPNAPPILAFRPAGNRGFEYTVQRGDTLKRLARYWFNSREFADLKGEQTLREWNPGLVGKNEPTAGTRLNLKIMTWNAREIVVCDDDQGKKFVQDEDAVEAQRLPAATETPVPVAQAAAPAPVAIAAVPAPAPAPNLPPLPAPSPTPKE
jgi:hypothetical protein